MRWMLLLGFQLVWSQSGIAGDVISCKNKPKVDKVMCVVNLENAAVDQKVKIVNDYGHDVAAGSVHSRRGLRWLVAVEPGRFPVKQGYRVEQMSE